MKQKLHIRRVMYIWYLKQENIHTHILYTIVCMDQRIIIILKSLLQFSAANFLDFSSQTVELPPLVQW